MITLLLALIYLAFVSLGLPDSLLGSAWPTMHIQLDINVEMMGILTMIISGGTIISSLFSDKLTKKFKTWGIVTFSILLTSIALFGFSISKNFFMLCMFALPYGFGAGAIDSSLNNYVALHYSSRQMSWLHCFWGVGTIISPYVMSYALTYHSSYELGYKIVSLIQLSIFIIILLSFPIWKKCQKSDLKIEENKSLSFKEKFKIKGILFVLIGFFAYCAFEATLMSWSATYLVEAKGIDRTTAAAYGALFFIGITTGRFLVGFIGKVGDKLLIRGGIVIILIGLLLLFIPTSINLISLIGLVVIGFGCAPVYPCIIHSTPSNFGNENSSAVISLQMACAYIGATFVPPLYGLIVKHISAALFPYFILFFVIILITMNELLNKTVKKKSIVK